MNGLWVMGLGFGGWWLLDVWVALDVGVVGFWCCFGGSLGSLDWRMFGAVGLWVLVWISVWPDQLGVVGWFNFGDWLVVVVPEHWW